MTFRAKGSQSRSHVTTIILNFTLVSLTFTMTSHLVGLLLEVAVSFFFTHLIFYILNSLYTQLPMLLSSYALNFSLLCLCTSWKNIPLRYLFEIVHLLRPIVCNLRLLYYVTKKFNYRLDTIDVLFWCGSQPCP